MAWTAERSTVNQAWQIGAESTTALGTSVAAGKKIAALNFDDGIEADVAFYRETGHKYPSAQEENREWASAAISGPLDYNAILYLLAGVMGSASPVSHGSSSTAKDWVYTPPLSGSIVPQTYTIEKGDTIRAQKYTYALINGFGYKASRKEATCNAKVVMQPIADAITMTSTPTSIALAPIVSKHINVYLDSTSAGLGTTLLTRALNIEYSFDNVYDWLWALNRANIGPTAHVDTVPKASIKLKLEADSNGMAPLSYLQSGVTYYLRVNCQGNQIASDGPGVVYNTFNHDMAIKFDKPSKFEDEQGVFALEWNCQVVEDATWGKSQTATVTNLLTAL